MIEITEESFIIGEASKEDVRRRGNRETDTFGAS